MIIRSNSIILASDLSPAFQAAESYAPFKRGLFPIAFVQNLAFDAQGNRIRSKQIGSQDNSVENLAFAPTVSLSFDYLTSLTFDNENLFGMFFKGWGDFQSVFKGSNGQSCNLYFILPENVVLKYAEYLVLHDVEDSVSKDLKCCVLRCSLFKLKHPV